MPGFHTITPGEYDLALNSFRQDPGNILAAARASGLNRATIRKLWAGPLPHKLATDGFEPCRVVVQREAKAEHEAKMALEAEHRALAKAEHERRKRLEEESARMEENMMRLGRNNALGGMTFMASLVPGMKQLAVRLGDQLARGVDRNGQPLDIEPEKALRILQRFGIVTRDLTIVGKQLIELGRHQDGVPTAGAIDSSGEPSTIEEARDLLAVTQDAIERADRAEKLQRSLEPGAAPMDVEWDADAPDEEEDEEPGEPERSTIGQPPLGADEDDEEPGEGEGEE